MIFDKMASLGDIKADEHVVSNIIWDIEPRQLMEPKYIKKEDGKTERKILRGYVFYIDKMAQKKPSLFLLCHTTMGYAETVAMVEEIPDEMIAEAMEENKAREYFGMYPINKKIENWLKKELGTGNTT